MYNNPFHTRLRGFYIKLEVLLHFSVVVMVWIFKYSCCWTGASSFFNLEKWRVHPGVHLQDFTHKFTRRFTRVVTVHRFTRRLVHIFVVRWFISYLAYYYWFSKMFIYLDVKIVMIVLLLVISYLQVFLLSLHNMNFYKKILAVVSSARNCSIFRGWEGEKGRGIISSEVITVFVIG